MTITYFYSYNIWPPYWHWPCKSPSHIQWIVLHKHWRRIPKIFLQASDSDQYVWSNCVARDTSITYPIPQLIRNRLKYTRDSFTRPISQPHRCKQQWILFLQNRHKVNLHHHSNQFWYWIIEFYIKITYIHFCTSLINILYILDLYSSRTYWQNIYWDYPACRIHSL